ncbi:acyltransferase family protein [Algoriphagus aquimarinus]|uniref:Acyltransferase family protein n=1 Tax=Algoriphagus aquimarinus TaxID=237018 RepID=A0A5C7ALZ1_9BACT|nr:acyltransferase family protein [Algoriphagus aquimarinus]TXE08944.1 acyltransferase family protein [Algoriphagus aquimarinus]
MNTVLPKTERLHSLDSLRAIMMLLGLVIHSSITYGLYEYGDAWRLKDPSSNSMINDLIVFFIHSFRMQIFFVVSGFFGAMLFYERKPLAMIKNRVSRIVYPFIVFVILLWPLIFFSFTYTGFVFAGESNAWAETMAIVGTPLILIPQTTFHLWFLYYLILILGVSTLIAFAIRKTPSLANTISIAFSWIIQKPVLRVLFFAVITGLVYLIMGISQVETSNSFIPDFNTFFYYFTFFIVGWVLFKSKEHLDSMKRLDWVCTVLGIVLFFGYALNVPSYSFEMTILVKSLVVWLLIFGFTGLFLRYGSKHSARMRYISDASYWVYLVHLPIAAFIPALIFEWQVPAMLKFLTVLSVTSIICFSTYHLFVRSTFIGKFLNGRKYTRSVADIRHTEEARKVSTSLT